MKYMKRGLVREKRNFIRWGKKRDNKYKKKEKERSQNHSVKNKVWGY